MAGKAIKGITVKIEGDTKGLGKALKDSEDKSKKLNQSLKDVNQALKLNPKDTELVAEKQRILAESIETTRDKLDTLKGVQDQVADQYARGEIDQGAYLAFRAELGRTEQALQQLEQQQASMTKTFKQKMSEAQQAVKDASQSIKDAGEAVQNAGKSTSEFGGKVTKGVTAPIMAAGTAAFAAFNKIDDGYDMIAKKTGAHGDDLASLQESYKTIASTTPHAMESVAAAVGEVNTRFHTQGKQLEQQTELLLEFAAITDGEVVSATDSADKALRAWGRSASELPGYLGMIAAKSQETGMNAQKLQDDLQANASTLKELGFTMEESVNLMAQMDAQGVDTGTALAGLKKAMANNVDAGMSQADALAAVIDSIKNAENETEALAIAQETFGAKGAAEMATAIREGRIDIDNLSDSTRNYGDVVASTYGETVGDASDELKTATNALTVAGSELGGTISEMLAPVLIELAEIIRGVIQWFNGLDDEQKQSIVRFGLLLAAVGPVIGIVGALISGVGTVISVLGTLGSVLAFLCSPVGLIVAAIAALVAIFVTAYNKSEWFRSKVDSVINAVKNVFQSGINFIRGLFNFSWEFPKLKMPHFKITGSFSLSPPSVPKLGVEWYAKGGILSGAQIFGSLGGNLLGGGEAGQEAVLPLDAFYRELRAILSHTHAAGGIVVQLRIEHFENSGPQSLDQIVEYVEDTLTAKLAQQEGAFA